MKKILYILPIMLFAALSCSKESDRIDPNEIKFQIGLPGTKATASAFENGDAISLYAVEREEGEQMPLQVGGNFINNERLSYNGSAWSASRTLYWSDKACDFYGVYPYQASIGSIEKYPFTVAVNQDGPGYEASDLLYAFTPNVARAGGPVALQFKHVLSKLVVRLVKGPQYEGEIPDDVVAHIYNTVGSCFFDLTHGSVEKDAFGARNTITMLKIDNSTFEAVLVPQNLERKTPLVELTMGGIAYLLEYSLSFRAGYVHTITVTLNTSPDQEQIAIEIDPGIDNWN